MKAMKGNPFMEKFFIRILCIDVDAKRTLKTKTQRLNLLWSPFSRHTDRRLLDYSNVVTTDEK